MEKSNKGIKRAAAIMGTILVGACTFAGGAALTEQQAQTKYEQMLEEEKQSAVDEYKQTIVITPSEEELEKAREEGRQEGYESGYNDGYLAGSVGAEEGENIYSTIMNGQYVSKFADGDFIILTSSGHTYAANKASESITLLDTLEIDGETQSISFQNSLNLFYDGEKVVMPAIYYVDGETRIRYIEIDYATLSVAVLEDFVESACPYTFDVDGQMYDLEGYQMSSGDGKINFAYVPVAITEKQIDLRNCYQLEYDSETYTDWMINQNGEYVLSATSEEIKFRAAYRVEMLNSENPEAMSNEFIVLEVTCNMQINEFSVERIEITEEEFMAEMESNMA